jgi:hypothetical protein
MIFIETLTQHYQSLDVLELLLDCIQLKLDFPFERKELFYIKLCRSYCGLHHVRSFGL